MRLLALAGYGSHMEAMTNLKAVIFDLDDTLVESTIDFGKFKLLVIDRIVYWGEPRNDYSPEETIVVITNRYESRLRESGIPETIIKARLKELDIIMDEVELERVHETKAIRGALRLVRLLRSRGVKIGVLTRSCQEYTDTAISVSGMEGLFDAVECRNSETKPKPDPAAYYKLVKALGVRKEETVFIGDHPIDAQCARNAGVKFIGVGTGDIPESKLMEAGSTMVFRDVEELADWYESSTRN